MWKDVFYLRRAERRACLLLCLILLAQAGILLFVRRDAPDGATEEEEESATLKDFLGSVREVPLHSPEGKTGSARATRKETSSRPAPALLPESRKEREASSRPALPFRESARELRPTPFDPNRADSAELSGLGLSPFVVSNILKYRRAGGTFRRATDLARIYGLADSTFRVLEPFVTIAGECPADTAVDVNRAGAAELRRTAGIGGGLARAIISYRERLGGFHSLDQVREAGEVDEALLARLRLGDAPLRRLEVNRAGLDRLSTHPYLSFRQARAIVKRRRKGGKLKSLSELARCEEFTEADLARLAPYLSFD